MKKLLVFGSLLIGSTLLSNEALAISTSRSTVWSRAMDYLGSGFVLVGAGIMVAIIVNTIISKKKSE